MLSKKLWPKKVVQAVKKELTDFTSAKKSKGTRGRRDLKQPDEKKRMSLLHSAQRKMETLDPNDEITKLWLLFQSEKQKRERLQVVDAAYYPSGKIRDLLLDMKKFVVLLDRVDNVDIARKMGYENYVIFIKIAIEKLKESCRESQPLQSKNNPASMEQDAIKEMKVHALCSFICLECYSSPGLYALSQLCSAEAETLSCNAVAQQWDLYNAGKQRGQGEEFDKAKERLQKRIDVLEAKNEASERLYESLTTLLTQEWFDRLDPENLKNGIAQMSIVEVKSTYSEAVQKVVQRLPMDV